MVEEQLSKDRVRDVALPILKRMLGEFGVEDLEIVFEKDHDGDPIITLTALYGPRAAEPDPGKSIRAAVAIQQAVFRAGDSRTVHLHHVLPWDAEGLPDY